MLNCYGCFWVMGLEVSFFFDVFIFNVFFKVFIGSMYCFYD